MLRAHGTAHRVEPGELGFCLTDAGIEGRGAQERGEVAGGSGKAAQIVERLAHSSLAGVDEVEYAVDSDRRGEEQPGQEGLLRLQLLERRIQPISQLGATGCRQRVHPSIRPTQLRDDLRLDRAIGLQTIQRAVYLRLIRVPEMSHGPLERAIEVISASGSKV